MPAREAVIAVAQKVLKMLEQYMVSTLIKATGDGLHGRWIQSIHVKSIIRWGRIGECSERLNSMLGRTLFWPKSSSIIVPEQMK
eukprot:1160300-Pelagomonas_calceolata.AAC.9